MGKEVLVPTLPEASRDADRSVSIRIQFWAQTLAVNAGVCFFMAVLLASFPKRKFQMAICPGWNTDPDFIQPL